MNRLAHNAANRDPWSLVLRGVSQCALVVSMALACLCSVASAGYQVSTVKDLMEAGRFDVSLSDPLAQSLHGSPGWLEEALSSHQDSVVHTAENGGLGADAFSRFVEQLPSRVHALNFAWWWTYERDGDELAIPIHHLPRCMGVPVAAMSPSRSSSPQAEQLFRLIAIRSASPADFLGASRGSVSLGTLATIRYLFRGRSSEMDDSASWKQTTGLRAAAPLPRAV